MLARVNILIEYPIGNSLQQISSIEIESKVIIESIHVSYTIFRLFLKRIFKKKSSEERKQATE